MLVGLGMDRESIQGQAPCTCALHALDPSERQAHREIVTRLRAETRRVLEIAGGVRLEFRQGDELTAEVLRFVQLEQRCCPFLRFYLILEPPYDTVALELVGPDEAREVIRAELGW
jgi:hypothetical protein